LKYNGAPVSLQLPQYVELVVVSADLGLRGDTAAGANPALVGVPTFVIVTVSLPIRSAFPLASPFVDATLTFVSPTAAGACRGRPPAGTGGRGHPGRAAPVRTPGGVAQRGGMLTFVTNLMKMAGSAPIDPFMRVREHWERSHRSLHVMWERRERSHRSCP